MCDNYAYFANPPLLTYLSNITTENSVWGARFHFWLTLIEHFKNYNCCTGHLLKT